jgi:hypothetical protein
MPTHLEIPRPILGPRGRCGLFMAAGCGAIAEKWFLIVASLPLRVLKSLNLVGNRKENNHEGSIPFTRSVDKQ